MDGGGGWRWQVCTPVTRALLLSTYIKLVNLFPDLKAQARPAQWCNAVQHGATQYNMVQRSAISHNQALSACSATLCAHRTHAYVRGSFAGAPNSVGTELGIRRGGPAADCSARARARMRTCCCAWVQVQQRACEYAQMCVVPGAADLMAKVQRATTCNGQLATDNMQRTTCNGQHATDNMQRTTCNVRP